MNTRPENTAHSLAYSAMGDLGSRILLLAGYIVLARFLSPAEFGLITVVSVLIAILGVIVELGFGAAVIQRQDVTGSLTQTAFWTNTLAGMVLSCLIILSAGLTSEFFGIPELEPIVQATAVVLLWNGMAKVPLSLLMKRREFRKVAAVDLVAGICSVGLGIVLAIGGAGVFSLVAMIVISSLLKLVLSFWFSQWRPRLAYTRRDLKELAGYGLPLSATRLYTQVAVNVDKLLIGKMLSTSLLGAYRLAFQIVELPTQVIAGVFHRVFFSVYVDHGDDTNRIRKTHLLATRSVAFFTFPALLGISVLSERFVLVFLGERWIEMAPILSFLAVISLFRNVGVLNDVLYLSQGATGLQFKVVLLLRSVVILGVVIGVRFGIVGLLWGLLAARVFNLIPAYHFSGKLVGLSVLDVLKNLWEIVALSLLMSVLLYLVQARVSAATDSLTAFLFLVLFGAAVYLTCSYLFMRDRWNEILVNLAQQFRGDAKFEN